MFLIVVTFRNLVISEFDSKVSLVLDLNTLTKRSMFVLFLMRYILLNGACKRQLRDTLAKEMRDDRKEGGTEIKEILIQRESSTYTQIGRTNAMIVFFSQTRN